MIINERVVDIDSHAEFRLIAEKRRLSRQRATAAPLYSLPCSDLNLTGRLFRFSAFVRVAAGHSEIGQGLTPRP